MYEPDSILGLISKLTGPITGAVLYVEERDYHADPSGPARHIYQVLTASLTQRADHPRFMRLRKRAQQALYGDGFGALGNESWYSEDRAVYAVKKKPNKKKKKK